MIFSSTYFLFLFLPIVLFVYYVPLKKFRNAQNVFLLISSLLFYAFGEPKFVFIMILSILINYIFGILVDRFRKDKLKSKLILQVHDELIIDTLISEKQMVEEILVSEMENALSLPVKLTVSLGSGNTWFEAK